MIKNANVTIMVSDMERSIKFYTETLGLKLKQRYKNEFAEIEATGLTIGLHPSEMNRSKPSSDSISIGFGVDDLKSAIAQFQERGVEFSSEVVKDGPIQLAFFTDPDKNPLYLAELKKTW